MADRISLIPQPTSADIGDLRSGYAKTLSGTLEPYIEELVSYDATAYLILNDGETIGYCFISSKKVLLQFHVLPEKAYLAEDAFAYLVSHGLIEKALVLTRDPLCLALCMDWQKDVSVRCHLFADGVDLPAPPPGSAGTAFRHAVAADIPAIRAACGDFHDFLDYTLEDSIEREEIFVLLEGSDILASGVISGRNALHPYVDIGMCVSEAHRRRGIGTYIVTKLRDYCHRMGWVPGASCQSTNIASKRTLEKAGMINRDRVLEIAF